MAKTATPQAISALLRRAGFERSTYGDKGVMWNEASTGFSVWRTYHQDVPQQPYVAVQHHIKDADYSDVDRVAYAEMRARLEEYAVVIRAAGYPALVRDRGDEPPWLTILTVAAPPEED